MREAAKRNRDAMMEIDIAGSAEYAISQVNKALKEYGGYVGGYLQLIESNRNDITSSIEYKFQIVRDDK